MTSQTRQQIITTHILPNKSRSKGNQAMKIGQLMKYNVRTVFVLDTLFLYEHEHIRRFSNLH